MFILAECEECGFIWSTMSLANECARIDRKRAQMRKEDNDNMNKNFRTSPKDIKEEVYP